MFQSSSGILVLILNAVLGLNGLNGVRRLARVLLADPLAPESEWERQLTDHDDKDERAFLLRYFQLQRLNCGIN